MAEEALTLVVDLGEILKTYRQRKRRLNGNTGYRQEDVARWCKVDPKTYRGWEKGEGKPSTVMLMGLAKLLDIPDDDLAPLLNEAITRSGWNGVSAGRVLCNAAA